MANLPPGGDRRSAQVFDRRRSTMVSGHLELLSKMSGHLAVTLNLDETIQKALDLIVKFVQAEGGALFLLEEKYATLLCKASAGPVDIRGIRVKVGEGIVGHCVTENTSRIVRDVQQDADFDHTVDESTGFQTRSILCTPMIVNGQKLGAIELVNKHTDDGLFSDTDLLMLQTLASAAALAINNAHMAEELVEQERVSRELELATEMQRSLLPVIPSKLFPVAGINLPANEMSGDFYDFFELEDGRIYFSLGDVSGKGMDAALLMSKTASLFRCLGKTIHEPNVLLATINRELCETAIHGMFVTMACGLLDPKTGIVELANAGHEPPLIHARDGTFTALPASAPPLGIMSLQAGDNGIREETFNLDGGTLYIFTDGVTEGCLEDGSRLEQTGFQDIMRERSDLPIAARIKTVVSILSDTGRKRHDDITLLAVEDARPELRHNAARDWQRMVARFTFPARADALQSVREVVNDACKTCGCVTEDTTDIIIAIGEACQNVVRHAYKGIDEGDATLEIYCEDGILEFRLQDSARPIDREKIKPKWPKELGPGGLGICLIHDIMDKVEYLPTPEDQGNLLRMVKFIKRKNSNEA
ncbi:MAG: SpoIIE family protein phosphatase [Gammaproteobacteria bacterium]|jgi:sigma-B regulation protein RsbU (phosphoserine phosphatase)